MFYIKSNGEFFILNHFRNILTHSVQRKIEKNQKRDLECVYFKQSSSVQKDFYAHRWKIKINNSKNDVKVYHNSLKSDFVIILEPF